MNRYEIRFQSLDTWGTQLKSKVQCKYEWNNYFLKHFTERPKVYWYAFLFYKEKNKFYNEKFRFYLLINNLKNYPSQNNVFHW